MKYILLILLSTTTLATNAIDKSITELLAWDDVELADTISDYGQITLMASPFLYSVLNDHPVENLRNSAIVTGANYVATHIAKFAAARIRPNKSNDRSFWSGHTSSSFTGSLLLCKLNRKACIPSFALATSVAYFRIAARKHWFTDTLIGAYVGYAGSTMTYNLVFRI